MARRVGCLASQNSTSFLVNWEVNQRIFGQFATPVLSQPAANDLIGAYHDIYVLLSTNQGIRISVQTILDSLKTQDKYAAPINDLIAMILRYDIPIDKDEVFQIMDNLSANNNCLAIKACHWLGEFGKISLKLRTKCVL